MVGGLIPAHIRSSTVDVSATGFASLHTLRHHPSDRITLMSHLQETPSLAAWVQVRWQAASPLNEWMNELKACSPTLVASVCANYKVWQHEWGNSVDWTLWYTEGVHVRGLEETTQPQCHTGGPRCHKYFLSFNKGYIHAGGSGKRAHKEGWRLIILGKKWRQSAKSQDSRGDCVEYPGNGENSEKKRLSIPALERILGKKGHVKPHAPVNQMRRQHWHTLGSVCVSICMCERVWSRVSLCASHHKSTLWWFLMACQAKTQALLVEATAVCVCQGWP